jgi:hypothetical protein
MLDGIGGASGFAMSLLDPATGQCSGRLGMARLTRDYGYQGLFQVAWKPVLAMEGMTLEVTEAKQWTTLAPRVLGGLSSLRAARSVAIHGVVIQVGSPAVVISAVQGTVSAAGELVLDHAVVAAPGKATQVFARLIVPLARPAPGIWTESASAGSWVAPAGQPSSSRLAPQPPVPPPCTAPLLQ